MSIGRPFVAAAIACAALIFASHFPGTWGTSPSRAISNCSTSSAALNAAEQEMLRLHNDVRARNGLPALTPVEPLNRAAAWKSEDSSGAGGLFGHTDSLGRNPSARAQDCGYSSGAGENIAYGYASASATFNAWMNSPGHYTNIMESRYVAIGVGQSGDRWTVKFGTVLDGGAAPPTATAVPPTATRVLPTAVPATPTRPRPTATAQLPSPTATPISSPAAAPHRAPPRRGPASLSGSFSVAVPGLTRGVARAPSLALVVDMEVSRAMAAGLRAAVASPRANEERPEPGWAVFKAGAVR